LDSLLVSQSSFDFIIIIQQLLTSHSVQTSRLEVPPAMQSSTGSLTSPQSQVS
jgi:hypothetical protein